MRLLDLFHGAGGVAEGYRRAGFDVVGVDIAYHKASPFPQVVADALAVMDWPGFLDSFDVVHASPPCQANSRTQHLRDAQGKQVKAHGADLIGPVRDRLKAWGGPYVIENVPGAPLEDPVVLCGSMFGLGVYRDDGWRQLRRHRLFESNLPLENRLVCQHEGKPLGVYGSANDSIPKGGQTARNVAEAQQLMEIGWMSRWDDLKEAIPPAFTEHIGNLLLDHVACGRCCGTGAEDVDWRGNRVEDCYRCGGTGRAA